MREFRINFKDLKFSIQDVYEVMGYGKAVPEKEVQKQTEMLLTEAASITTPQFAYFITDGILNSDSLMTETCSFSLGKIIGRQLRNSECFVFFVATSGQEFEDWMDVFKKQDDIVSTFIADSLGTCVAEATADYFENHLYREVSAYGWSHTNRYSPGYCEWHVSEQQKLFSLFPDAPCGVRLTDSSLMLPIKTVSGVVGVGMGVKRYDYSCGLCTMENCYKKRIRETHQTATTKIQ